MIDSFGEIVSSEALITSDDIIRALNKDRANLDKDIDKFISEQNIKDPHWQEHDVTTIDAFRDFYNQQKEKEKLFTIAELFTTLLVYSNEQYKTPLNSKYIIEWLRNNLNK